MVEVDPKTLFRLQRVCKNLHAILATPHVWTNVISGLLGRPYAELPFDADDARDILKFISQRKKNCDVSDYALPDRPSTDPRP